MCTVNSLLAANIRHRLIWPAPTFSVCLEIAAYYNLLIEKSWIIRFSLSGEEFESCCCCKLTHDFRIKMLEIFLYWCVSLKRLARGVQQWKGSPLKQRQSAARHMQTISTSRWKIHIIWNRYTAQQLVKAIGGIDKTVFSLSYYCGMSTSSLPVVFLFVLYSHS